MWTLYVQLLKVFGLKNSTSYDKEHRLQLTNYVLLNGRKRLCSEMKIGISTEL